MNCVFKIIMRIENTRSIYIVCETELDDMQYLPFTIFEEDSSS